MNALAVLYEDAHMVVVDKPHGLPTIPGRTADLADCVASRMRARYPDAIAQPCVHRLDMDTAGLLVLARTAAAHRALSIAFAERKVQKGYEAELVRPPRCATTAGTIELPHRVDHFDRPRQIYDPLHGKQSVTHWELMHGTRVALTPVTGRTHQLRVHASHPLGLGAPILGDRLYGTREPGQTLHLWAVRLAFAHPHTGAWMVFER